MAFLRVFYLLAILCIGNYRPCIAISALANEELLEQHLNKLLNKPSIKTIEVDHGVFDCVDVYKQPAFDNPLLKNHKIQMKPTELPSSSRKFESSGFGIYPGCPYGTVPIRRTTEEDLLRQNSYGQVQYLHPNVERDPLIHVIPDQSKHKFSGARASISVHNPDCLEGEVTGAQIWLSDSLNEGIFAGWMVDPAFYGDFHTHFTATFFGKGGIQCSNMRCPGFMQTNPNIPLGFLLPNISGRGKENLHDIPTSIFQDKNSRNWWLIAGDDTLGYWPRELFSTLDDGALSLSYGGVVKGLPNQYGPSMGSGIKKKCKFDQTAYFKFVEYQVFDDYGGIYLNPTTKTTKLYSDCSNYEVFCNEYKGDLKFYFLYGGRRGSC